MAFALARVALAVLVVSLAACAKLSDRRPEAGPVLSPTPSSEGHSYPADDDPLMQDAAYMAEELGITVEQAYDQLKLQGAIGVFGGRLERHEAATFASLVLHHEPPFRIEIFGTTSTFDFEEYLPPELEPIRDVIEYRQVMYSLEELESAAQEFYDAAPRAPFDSWIEAEASRIIVRAESQKVVDRLEEVLRDQEFSLPDEAFVIEVGPVAQPG